MDMPPSLFNTTGLSTAAPESALGGFSRAILAGVSGWVTPGVPVGIGRPSLVRSCCWAKAAKGIDTRIAADKDKRDLRVIIPPRLVPVLRWRSGLFETHRHKFGGMLHTADTDDDVLLALVH